MAKCSRCGCKFDKEDLDLFGGCDLNMIPEEMCLKCLEKAYEEGESGLFFDTCEECGKVFEVFEEESFYNSIIEGDDGVGFGNYERILCGECTLVEREEVAGDQANYSDVFFDDKV